VFAALPLALRFVLELTGLVACAVAGYNGVQGPARWLAAIAAAVALAVFWAFVVAPRAVNPIALPLREVIGSLALLCAAGALALAGHPGLATVFALLIVTNNVLLAVLRDRITDWEVAR